MIPDSHTNKVYFAEDTFEEFPEELAGLKGIIEAEGYKVKMLEGTSDFYCRDFMPVQISKTDFVQFVFNPKAYFGRSDYQYISNPVSIALVNKLIQPRHSNLILDGGNVVKGKDKVIISDRVYKDNIAHYNSTEAILNELEKVLQCQVIIIPEYPEDRTGHADGLIRFVNDYKVVVNDTRDEIHTDWLEEFMQVLVDNGLETVELPCLMEENQDSANGLYINFLQVGKLIVVPQFSFTEDIHAIEIIQHAFPNDFKVAPFEAGWISKYGGVFNCASWNIIA